MMMALGAGIVVPNVLRWYWWRLNGWGYAAGTLSGILLALVALILPGTPDYLVFTMIISASLAASVVVSLITQPVSRDVLTRFYSSVRPFGWWKPAKDTVVLAETERSNKSESATLTVLNVVLGMIAISGLYLFPMYLVGHWYTETAVCLGLAAAAIVALKFTWHDNLPLPATD